jgi:hydroxymethylglutaryl-CoA lyase
MTSGLPVSARVMEVGPRDGLQNEKEIISTATKIAFVNMLSGAGLRDIEVTSFVSPRAVPQLADAAEVLAGIEKRKGTRYSVLVPNMRGLERWLEIAENVPSQSRGIALFTAASEAFNRKNTNAGIAESLETFGLIVKRLQAELGASRPFLRGYVSTAFRCPYEGWIAPEQVESVSRELFALGVDEVSLGDTIGAATPKHVADLLDRLAPSFGTEKLAMHFHDTRGTALANVLAAMEHGISIFDSSAGGLGGCPFAPGAAGNLATEDLIYMLNGMEIETGVDLHAVAAASATIEPAIGHALPSKELQAIRSTGF